MPSASQNISALFELIFYDIGIIFYFTSGRLPNFAAPPIEFDGQFYKARFYCRSFVRHFPVCDGIVENPVRNLSLHSGILTAYHAGRLRLLFAALRR